MTTQDICWIKLTVTDFFSCWSCLLIFLFSLPQTLRKLRCVFVFAIVCMFSPQVFSLTFLRRSHVSCRYLPPLMSLLILFLLSFFSYFLVLPTFMSSASHSGFLTFSRRKNYASRHSPADGMELLLKAFPISSISLCLFPLFYFILYCDWTAHGRSDYLRLTCAHKVSHTHTHTVNWKTSGCVFSIAKDDIS